MSLRFIIQISSHESFTERVKAFIEEVNDALLRADLFTDTVRVFSPIDTESDTGFDLFFEPLSPESWELFKRNHGGFSLIRNIFEKHFTRAQIDKRLVVLQQKMGDLVTEKLTVS